MLQRLFAPLGYAVQVENPPLDTTFPEWGASEVFTRNGGASIQARRIGSPPGGNEKAAADAVRIPN